MIYLISDLIDDEGGFVEIFRSIWKFAENVVRSSQYFWAFMNQPIKLNLVLPGSSIPFVGQIVTALNIVLGNDWLPSFTLLQAFSLGLPILVLMGLYIIKTFVPLA